MQNSIWKLTSLAGVIGITCLTVVLLQQNAPQSESDLLDPVDDSEVAAEGTAADESELLPPVQSELPAQSNEPTLANEPTLVVQNQEPPENVNPFESNGLDFNTLPDDFQPTEDSAATDPQDTAFPALTEQNPGVPTLSEPTLAEPTLAEPTLAESTPDTGSPFGDSLAEPTLAEPNLAEPTLAEPTLAEPSLAEFGDSDPGPDLGGGNPFATGEDEPESASDSVPVPDAILNASNEETTSDEFPEFPTLAADDTADEPTTPTLTPTEEPQLLPTGDPLTQETPLTAENTTDSLNEPDPFSGGPALIGGAPNADAEPVVQTAGESDEPAEDPFGTIEFPGLNEEFTDDEPEPMEVTDKPTEAPSLAPIPEEAADDFPALGLDDPIIQPAQKAAGETGRPIVSGENPFAVEAAEAGSSEKPDSTPAAESAEFDPFALDQKSRDDQPTPAEPAATTADETATEFPALGGPFDPKAEPAVGGADSPTPVADDSFPSLGPAPATATPSLEPVSADTGNDPAPAATADFPGLPALPATADAPADPEPLTDSDSGPDFGSQENPATATPAEPTPAVTETTPKPAAENMLIGDAKFDSSVEQKTMRPQLKIEKSAPDSAVLGKPFVYRILVRNTGQTDAHNVVVQDRIPKGTELTGTIPRAELADKTLIWKYETIGAGKQVRISIRVVPREEGPIGSVATVTSVAQVTARTTITSPQLALTLKSVEKAKLGAPVVYEFTVTNSGTGTAKDVFIRNVLPEGLTHAEGSDLEYEVGALKAGESRSVRLTLQTTRPGEVTNRAVATAEGGLRTTAESSLLVAGHQLRLTRTGPKTRFVGKEATFKNEVMNESDSTVKQAVVIETLPEGMEFVDASNGGQYDKIQRTVNWTIDQIPAGEKQNLEIKVVPKQAGTQTSVVELHEPNGNQSRTVARTEVASFTSLGLDVSEVDRPITVGERIVMTVRARNRGTSPARNVAIKVQIPKELSVVEVRSNNQLVKFTNGSDHIELPAISTLAGRDKSEFEIMLKATASADVRFGVQVNADELSKPVSRDEAIIIVNGGE